MPPEELRFDPDEIAPIAPWLRAHQALILTAFQDGSLSGARFGRVNLEAYQIAPVLRILAKPRPRLLIADDVGVGKTIEAALVARELVDRGLARRLGVLCPAHLVEQWTRELEEKFAFRPDRIQPATMAALERRLPRPDASVFAYSDCFVASIDFVKGERRREPFLRDAPDLVIVDEAHGCARPAGARSRGQQQRFDLLARLVERRPKMHLVLVTATPHAGIEESFRSLLGLLRPEFDGEGRLDRRRLRPFLVQRRRRDVARWLGPETPFPERHTREATYRLGPEQARLFEDVLDYCRARVSGPGERAAPRQRVRHWAAIALLRCVLSSPRAAATVLARRAGPGELLSGDEDPEAIDARFRPELLDAFDETPTSDLAPSAPLEAEAPTLPEADRRRLRELARRAASLEGPGSDPKLEAAVGELRGLLERGCSPIVFCRFVPTAAYLAEQLARAMPDVAIAAVTGELPDELRRERVEELARAPRRILVATDCLSEGINLQDHFDAVLHYDLPWNPNRLEQREGRVDRFGQPKPRVEAVVLYGADNEVDRAVLEVLIRKARRIREVLGVAVPVPAGAEEVLDAVVSSVLLRRGRQLRLALEEDAARPLLEAWDRAAAAEAEDRTYFAQEGIRPEEVERELGELDRVLASPAALQRFLRTTLPRVGGFLRPTARPGRFLLHPGEGERALAELLGGQVPVEVCFDRLADPEALHLGRTHPFVERLAARVLGEALEGPDDSLFARCGALRTPRVREITALLLLRLRYTLEEGAAARFAEEVRVVAATFDEADRLAFAETLETAGLALLEGAAPVAPEPTAFERGLWLERFLGAVRDAPSWHEPVTRARRAALVEQHERIRALTGEGGRLAVTPHPPPDLLGLFVLFPTLGERP
ncbi:MAG: DEAD/DEAH box helicase [Geminicoccaceae bacterium]|nr:DEAD/DEAH box helicase [Geminicoccaceae bacterium]